MKHLTDSHNLVMTAARQGVEIYGLTVGVGLNKDHKLFDATGELTDVARQASIDFNRNILRSTPWATVRRSIRRSCVFPWSSASTRCSRAAPACSPTWPNSTRPSSMKASRP